MSGSLKQLLTWFKDWISESSHNVTYQKKSMCYFPLFRYRPWHRHSYWRSHCHGTYRQPRLRSRRRWDPHRPGDWAFHPHHHRRGRVPWCQLLLPLLPAGLRLAGGCHLLDWYHCRQCARGSARYCHCKSRWKSLFSSLLCQGIPTLFGLFSTIAVSLEILLYTIIIVLKH